MSWVSELLKTGREQVEGAKTEVRFRANVLIATAAIASFLGAIAGVWLARRKG